MSQNDASVAKNVVLFLVRNLVETSGAAEIGVIETDDSVTYEIHVAQSDLGKVIGRQGRIANALRAVTKAAAIHETRKVFVEIAA